MKDEFTLRCVVLELFMAEIGGRKSLRLKIMNPML
jgi:hypothetical protein